MTDMIAVLPAGVVVFADSVKAETNNSVMMRSGQESLVTEDSQSTFSFPHIDSRSKMTKRLELSPII
jgi:hypothetical protein